MKIDIVITMGGLGSRFRKAGFRVPKYMIEVKGKTLFEWSMMSLEGFKDTVSKFIFVVLKDSDFDVKDFIEQQCLLLGIRDFKIVVLDTLTDGQATSAMMASQYWNDEHGLLIYNIDTYIEPGAMNSSQLKGDGFIPCFQAQGNHWSFAKLGSDGSVIEVREKERISEFCTVGAYYFKTCSLYQHLYKSYYAKHEHLVNGEKYVAPLYNHLIQQKGRVYISDINPRHVHVLGTPEEVNQFVSD